MQQGSMGLGAVGNEGFTAAPRISAPKATSVVALLRERAEASPGDLLYYFLDDDAEVSVAWTAADLDTRAQRIAGLLRLNAPPGARILLLYPPGLDYIAAFFACLYAGMIAVPAYPPNLARIRQTLPRLRAIVEDAQVTLGLTVDAFCPLLEQLPQADPVFSELRWLGTDALPAAPEPSIHAPAPGDLAFLQYTSGSTANPKGVMVTHANLLYTVADMDAAIGYREDEVFVSWLPTFHDMGLVIGLLLPLYTNRPVYLLSPVSFLQRPIRWLSAISRYRGTQTAAPNFAYELCARKVHEEQLAALDLRCWRIACNAAEPARLRSLENFARHFASCGVRREILCTGYGLAEATLKVTVGPLDALQVCRDALKKNVVLPRDASDVRACAIVSCGAAHDRTSFQIVDVETRAVCGPGVVGEIWVQGPNVAMGYWNRPAQSAEVFRACLSDGSGPYLRTGDLGFVHGGNLFITGRLKDMIIIDGSNHYPEDIEWTIQESHPFVRAGCCAAFSVDDGDGEALVVMVELGKAEPADAPEQHELVRRAIRQAISARHQVGVREVVLVKAGELPKTSSGKIQRHLARREYLDGTIQQELSWRGNTVTAH